MTIPLRGTLAVAFVAALAVGSAAAPAKAEESRAEAAREALSDLQFFIGVWRGSAQTQRGSAQGGWVENAEWSWQFDDDAAAIVFKAPDSKVFVSGRVVPGDEPSTFRLLAKPPESETEYGYTGELTGENRLLLKAEKPDVGRPAAVSVRLVAGGKRLVVVYQRQSAVTNRLVLLAEVGYTRKGSGFGEQKDLPECVLTGGEAAIPVTHKGETYYVCCTGCRDYFIENPEKVIAGYQERMAEKKNAKER